MRWSVVAAMGLAASLSAAAVCGAAPIVETWTRADGEPWPSAWVATTFSDSTTAAPNLIDIIGEQGRVRNTTGLTATGAHYHTDTLATDVDVSVTFSLSNGSQRAGLIARVSPDNSDTFYWLVIDDLHDTLRLFTVIDGVISGSPIASVSYTQSLTQLHHMRLRVQSTPSGTWLRGAAWLASEVQPNWLLSVVDAAPALQGIAGYVGLAERLTTNRTILFDNFSATLPEPAAATVLLALCSAALARRPDMRRMPG